ncbi:MAG TPA: M20/M25/M40 family metallo-hydrolase [Methylomirabilota bacterium]|nr:M20/M25/M40 family metallo-hydrolase [Methylomirabilota bacterium]
MLSAPEAQATAAVSEQEVVDLLRRLIAVDTSENEQGAVRVLEELLRSEGIEYRLDPIAPGRDNVLVTLGKRDEGSVLLFSAHTDTVPVGNEAAWSAPPLAGMVRDRRVYGRGATDCKGGLAAMVMAAVALARARVPLRGRVLVTCVAGETHGNLGTLHLAERGLAADFAIVGEYSEGDKIATTYRGGLWGRLVILGKTAHPGRPHLGADAIRAALDHFVPALRGYAFRFTPHPLVPDPQLTITQIDAGHRRSAIADRCVVTFDVRLVPGQRCAEVWRGLEAAVGAVAPLPGISARLERDYALDAFETPASHPHVKVLADCITEFTGRPPGVMGKVGMCDGNVLVNQLGIPSVAYGPGNPSGAAVDEYCDIDRLDLCTKVYILTAMRMLGV